MLLHFIVTQTRMDMGITTSGFKLVFLIDPVHETLLLSPMSMDPLGHPRLYHEALTHGFTVQKTNKVNRDLLYARHQIVDTTTTTVDQNFLHAAR